MSGGMLMIAAFGTPFVGAALIAILRGRPNLRETATLATAATMFGLVIALLPQVLAGEKVETPALSVIPGLDLKFALEPLGMLFALIASALWIVNSIYSIGYMRANEEPRQTSFYVFFALALAATLGIAFSGNLFTLFLFYEMLTFVTYPLVTHKQTTEAISAGRTYLLLLVSSSIVFLLTALVWVFWTTGTTDFQPGGIIAGKLTATETGLLLALFVFGIAKAAVMPLHRWLPAAMVAPTPVSALLHAVAVVKAGVFSIVKVIVYILGVDELAAVETSNWLVYVAGFTVIIASLIALAQDNLKRRLAYSTISQLSYVILAAAILTPLSIVAAAMHIAAHAFGKITLFFAAGAIYTATHKTEISQLDGIGRQMPWTMAAFSIGALSMIGLPPTGGFVSKWFLVTAAASAQAYFAIAVIILSTLLNAAYFVPIIYSAFFKSSTPSDQHHGEAPLLMVVALVITAAGTLALFLMPGLPLALSRQLGGLQ